MANTKISALTALTGANLATDDAFAVVDTSATATKKITVAEMKLGIMPAPGPIGGTTPSTGAFTTLSATTGAAVGGATPGTGGLAFPATAVAVADANTLDDYEEGSFTPTITLGGGSVTYTTQRGTYTKVGRLVTTQIYLQINVATTPSGAVTIGGLPFTASANVKGAISLLPAGFGAGATTVLVGTVDSSATTISVYKFAAGALSSPGADVVNGCALYATASYEV